MISGTLPTSGWIRTLPGPKAASGGGAVPAIERAFARERHELPAAAFRPVRLVGLRKARNCAGARPMLALRATDALARAELEPLNLPSGGLGQLVEELDPARVFVGRKLVFDVLLQRRLQRVAR
jgi:hypothetical protein